MQAEFWPHFHWIRTLNQYLYCDRDLFQEPESYEYALCEGKNFSNSWVRIRQDKIRQITDFTIINSANSQNISLTQEKVLGEGDRFLTDLLLATSENIEEQTQKKWIIDELVKKYEVFKKLYSAYSSSINRLPDAEMATLDEYLLFAKSEKYDNL